MVTITKGDLIALGYGPSFAADIIRETKKLMISRGHTYYQSRKLDRVPKEAVEELLGITIPDKQTSPSNRKHKRVSARFTLMQIL